MQNFVPNPMVPLPKLKSGKKKTHPKNFQKLLKTGKKQEKKPHKSPYKSSNILGESYVKPCAESNGSTRGLENWCNKKIRPKN